MADRSFRRKLLFTLIILGFLFCVIFILGEVILRALYPASVVSVTSYYRGKSSLDPQIGWVSNPNYTESFAMSDWKSDSTYTVTYQTGAHGFRQVGDPMSNKPRIFIVGDSYVQSAEVNSSETFYRIIADSLDVEVWAYGQAGYGTLQEYLIIDRYLSDIKPDLVILQTCDNDVIDNYAPLEYNSLYKVGLERPYLTHTGAIEYQVAKKTWEQTIDKSRLLKLLWNKLQNSILKSNQPSSQELMATQGKSYPVYAEAINRTTALLGKVREKVGGEKLLVISASIYEPMLGDLAQACRSQDISFDSSTAKAIEARKYQEPRINSSDGYHWNRHGQEIVAHTLIPIIQDKLSQ